MTPSEQFIEENEEISYEHAETICLKHHLNIHDFVEETSIIKYNDIDTQKLFNWLGY